jgi:hypothetical protein
MGGRRNVAQLLSCVGVGVGVGCAALLMAPLMSLTTGVPAGAVTSHAGLVGHVTANVAGTYVPLSPDRITDTRAGSGLPNAGDTLGAGKSINVQVTGVGAVPTTGVTAVVVNVTVVGPTASSYVSVFPEGTTQPVVSNLNFTVGETLANLATVPVGTQGGLTVYNYTGSVDVVVDVEGYYTTTSQTSGLYNPVNPDRVLGTLASGAYIGPNILTQVPVVGIDNVPSDASAVVANVTASASSGPGFLTVFPTPASTTSIAVPIASNVNFSTGQVIANRVIIPVGSNGEIDLYNNSGSVNVDIDLDGYYTGSAGELGSAYTPMSPVRVTDTRTASNGSQLGGGDSETFTFLSEGLSSTATALVANVTVVAGVGAGYLTVYPTTDSTPPAASDANFTGNAVAQSFAMAPLNGAATDLYNSSAVPVNIVIDAFGFFEPPPPAVAVVANPNSLAADGVSTSVVTATVTNGSGVSFDDPVSLALTPSVAGSCGTATAPGSTNASGQVMSTYTASSIAGTCTITATEANGGVQGSAVITQS